MDVLRNVRDILEHITCSAWQPDSIPTAIPVKLRQLYRLTSQFQRTSRSPA